MKEILYAVDRTKYIVSLYFFMNDMEKNVV